jgi:hypothetical protein
LLQAFEIPQRLHRLWEKAKSNDLEGITDEDRHTVRIMLAHKDENHPDKKSGQGYEPA